jgi:hypothetical protein
MITRLFAADDGVSYDADLAADTPDEILATVERIRSWGGSETVYRHFLSRALTVAGPTDRETVRSVAVLAGWRAGVTRLRSDALSRAFVLKAAICEAALGLPTDSASTFLGAQRDDPFAHPARGPLIGIVGGFRGLGGPWLQVPRDAVTTGRSTVAVRSGDDWWQIEADVFGATITRADETLTAAYGPLHARVGASYHVWLMRGAA